VVTLATPLAKPAGTVENPSSGTVLTVGAGMEFSSLAAALNASVNGDTILVQAGTYYNDFTTVNTNVTILAMGGVVNEVATEPPPNDKGLMLVNANLTIQGFTFTGGSDGSPDGNVAGIRYQSGNLNVQYCDFTNMQDGLLATPNVTGTGTITINQSEFSNDGTGDGLSHDIYIGAVASFTLTNSYVHNAIVGHEVKSRAASTTIKNNVIADGPGGDSSYEIDIPNGGVAVISGNTLEKGANASNPAVIHYGGETQYAWATNSLAISNNTIINNLPGGIAVNNQSAVNGLSVSASLTADTVYGIASGNLIEGPGTASATKTLSSAPSYSTASPWINPPAVTLGDGPELLSLGTSNNSVSGGGALFEVTDTAGYNSIAGGSGGMRVTASGGWDTVTSAANVSNSITLSGRNNMLVSNGSDTIIDNGTYDAVSVNGAATITAESFATFALAGVDTITVTGSGILDIAAGATISAVIGGSGGSGTLAQGGQISFSSLTKGGIAATVSGASGSFSATSGFLQLAFQSGNGTAVLDGGAYSVTGGVGNDSFTLQAGSTGLSLGNGNDTVSYLSGSDTIYAGYGTDLFSITDAKGASGTLTINNFQPGNDALSFTGFGATAVKSGSDVNGNTILLLNDGVTVDVVGVVLPGYAPVGSSGGGTTSSGGTILTGSGQSITGGSGLLTITDNGGGNTIAGGTGGLDAISVQSDVVTTKAKASNTVTLSGYDSFTGGGGDMIAVAGQHNLVADAGSASVTLSSTGNTVQGGGGLLSITDLQGSNTIVGGAGGVVVSGADPYETITTAAAAADTISAMGYSSLNLNGTDQVSLNGNYSYVTANGTDVIVANGGLDTFNLNGQDTVSGTSPGYFTIGAQASATLISTGQGGSQINLLQGGAVSLSQVLAGNSMAAVTVSGGSATLGSSGGNYAGITVTTNGQGDSITAGGGPIAITSAGADTIYAGTGALSVTASGALNLIGGAGAINVTAGSAGIDVQAGSGNITLQGGQGNDSFVGGTGSALLTLGAGNDSVTFGAGTTYVFAGGNDVFNVVAGLGGSDTISGWSAGDHVVFSGYGAGSPVVSQTVVNGNTLVTLSDGTSLTFLNATHPI
jgi:hypothetical protein